MFEAPSSYPPDPLCALFRKTLTDRPWDDQHRFRRAASDDHASSASQAVNPAGRSSSERRARPATGAHSPEPLGKYTVQPSHSCRRSVRMSSCQAGGVGEGLDNCSSWRTSVRATAGRAMHGTRSTQEAPVDPHRTKRNALPPANKPQQLTPGRSLARR